jgi:hypothetical protein
MWGRHCSSRWQVKMQIKRYNDRFKIGCDSNRRKRSESENLKVEDKWYLLLLDPRRFKWTTCPIREANLAYQAALPLHTSFESQKMCRNWSVLMFLDSS